MLNSKPSIKKNHRNDIRFIWKLTVIKVKTKVLLIKTNLKIEKKIFFPTNEV